MSKRVTIMINLDLDKKLRLKQAKMIQQENTSYSYSKVLNDAIRKALNKRITENTKKGTEKSKRVTVCVDEDLDKKLRLRQAKMIQQEQTSYSYSKVLNDTVRTVLK